MFTFNCYACGAMLHRSLPPVEALSPSQAQLLGHDPMQELKTKAMEGTPFEDMSSASFCEFCLALMREFPETFMRDPNNSYSSVKDELERMGALDMVDAHPRINREMRLRSAKTIYKNGDFSFVESLINSSIEKQDEICSFPGCEVIIGFNVPARRWPTRCCEKHQYEVKIEYRMGLEILLAIRGHDLTPENWTTGCQCDYCWPLWSEYMEDDYDAYQERLLESRFYNEED